MVDIQQDNAMQVIDPHLHLFNQTLGNYEWLQPANPPFWPDKQTINKDFSVGDIKLSDGLTLEGLVHIEAGFDNLRPWREIEWLQSLNKSNSTPAIKASASVDLLSQSKDFESTLERLTESDVTVGVRHILDEQAFEILQTEQAVTNLETLAQKGLIFECQLLGEDSRAIHQLVKTLQQLPNLSVVINHGAFPNANSSSYSVWLENIAKLAKLKQIQIKASGWEMIDRLYLSEQVQQITSTLINLYGEDRVMLASNFPLCLFSSSYQMLWQQYARLPFNSSQLEKLMADNARNFYRF